MLFSATLDGDIGRLAEAHTHDAVRHEITDDRPVVAEATHRFLAVDHPAKFRTLVRELAADRGLTLVFVRTKRGADRIARNLKKEGFRAGALHGDMSQPQRERALGHFAAGRNDVLIATDVAARGLDLEHISHVINYDPPADDKAYVHRVGRTARAGRAGTGITFVTPDQGADVGKIAKELSLHGEFADSGIRTHTTNQAPRRNGNGGAPKRQQRPNSSNRGRRRR